MCGRLFYETELNHSFHYDNMHAILFSQLICMYEHTAQQLLLKMNKSRNKFYQEACRNNFFKMSAFLMPDESAKERENISLAIIEAEQSLHSLWDVVGLGKDDRSRVLSDLFANIQNMISSVLEEEKELSEQYKTRIAEAVAEIADLSNQLGKQIIPQGNMETETLTQSVNRLDIELVSIREVHSSRFAALEKKTDIIRSLSLTLGSEVDIEFQSPGKDLTVQREFAIDEHISALQDEYKKRVDARSKLVSEMKDFLFELDMKCDSEMDRAVIDGGQAIGLTIATLGALSNRSAELQALKTEREALITNLAAQINELWEKLDIAEEERAAFFSQHHGVGLKEISACEKELSRLTLKKKEQLVPLLRLARQKIQGLWEELHCSVSQRQAFEPISVADSDADENTLVQHEVYLEQLKERAEQMRPIIRSINKREKIIADRDDLELREKNGSGADRLNSRGRDAFKRLQEEEKIRARAKKLLPKLNNDLLLSLSEWKVKYGTPLTYDGEEYEGRMERQAADYNKMKEDAKEFKRKQIAAKKENCKSKNEHGSAKSTSRSNHVSSSTLKTQN